MRAIRFNQGFALDRSLIKAMLQYIVSGKPCSDELLAAYIGVNPYKIEGLRGWFCKIGLGSGTSKNYVLSPFGNLLASYDPELNRSGTLWLLHYFLSSEHKERSELWYQCFNNFLHPGMLFSHEQLSEYVERSTSTNPTQSTGIKKDAQELIKTYTHKNALGTLGLFTRQPEKQILAGLSTFPEPFICAYMLFDTWTRRYPTTNTLRLSQLASEPETLGKMCVATFSQLRELILHLQAQGWLTYADTQHEPVTRRFQEPAIVLLEHYYQKI